MRIDGNKLIIDSPMSEGDVEEFLNSAMQSEISKIVVETEDLHASIVQILWCLKEEKKIKVKASFLKPFFEHVTQRSID